MSKMRDVVRTRVLRTSVAAAVIAVAVGANSAGAEVSSGIRPTLVSINPCRLLDTRPATTVGPRSTPLVGGAPFVVQGRGVTGNCTLPDDVVALQTNMTSVNGTADGYLTVYPADAPQPFVSSLNWVAGQGPTPNAVTIGLSATGGFAVYNSVGVVDLVIDVTGYYVGANYDDRYYTKGEIDAKLTSGGVVAVGPQGPAGQPGAQGAPGPQGPPGASSPRNVLTTADLATLRWDRPLLSERVAYPTGVDPRGIAFDGQNVWVTNSADDTVTKYDHDTGAATTYPVDVNAAVGPLDNPSFHRYPFGIAFDGTSMWIGNEQIGSYTRINATTGASAEFSLGTGTNPYGVAFDGYYIWVADASFGQVHKIDTASGTVVATFSVGGSPFAMAFDGIYMWAVNWQGDTVIRINVDTGATTPVSMGTNSHPYGIAFDGKYVWVTNFDTSTVARISDPRGTPTATFYPAPLNPRGIAFDGQSIWVNGYGSTTIARYNPDTGTFREFALGIGPRAIAFDGTQVWALAAAENLVVRFRP